MKLPSIFAKKTTRAVIDLNDASGDTLTVPLQVLRDVVAQTSEFGDTARAEFKIRHGFAWPGADRAPGLYSLIIEEER